MRPANRRQQNPAAHTLSWTEVAVNLVLFTVALLLFYVGKTTGTWDAVFWGLMAAESIIFTKGAIQDYFKLDANARMNDANFMKYAYVCVGIPMTIYASMRAIESLMGYFFTP